jgi:predicted RNase H-like nuclease (RuvC/YqgF family)
MPEIDPKVALMMLRFYVDLILEDDENCNIMEMLPGDSLMDRCIAVVVKHWEEEVCEPIIVDSERDHATVSKRGHSLSHLSATIHRLLPAHLQNYLLEKCLVEAKNDSDSAQVERESLYVRKNSEVESLQAKLENSNQAQEKERKDYHNQLLQLQRKTAELAKQLTEKTIALEEYKEELKNFRRVPGIHNFGDKTTCTYSANPDHHYPNHRRGKRRPTQMPSKGIELDNLGKENGYLYEDGKGGLLPVFYYSKSS